MLVRRTTRGKSAVSAGGISSQHNSRSDGEPSTLTVTAAEESQALDVDAEIVVEVALPLLKQILTLLGLAIDDGLAVQRSSASELSREPRVVAQVLRVMTKVLDERDQL